MSADEIVVVRLPAHGAELWPALSSAGLGLTGATRVAVLKGEGTDFFHAEAAEDGALDNKAAAFPRDDSAHEADRAVDWLRRPDLITIAAIAGRATGVGLFLSLACDLQIAADDAALAISDDDRDLGLAGTLAGRGVARLANALGYSQALELMLTGRRLSGRQAAAVGLVNLAVPADQLDAAVSDLVAAVLSTPRTAATQAKALLAASGEERRHRIEEVGAGLRLAGGEA